LMLLTSACFISTGHKIKNETTILTSPPEDFEFIFPENDIADWWHATIVHGGHNGCVEGIEDTGSDGKIGKCDYVVINWEDSNVRQPYYRYHIEDSEYITDPDDPNQGQYSFDFDYKSKSRIKPFSFEKSIYVDDDNTDGPWDGSFEAPYQSVMDALDAGSLEITAPGDDIQIIVEEGEYGILDDGVLQETYDDGSCGIAADWRYIEYNQDEATIIQDGSANSAITVQTDFLTLVNLGASESDINEALAGLEIHSDNNNIIGCEFYNNANGIYLLESASNNNFAENIIRDNDFGFFVDQNSNDNRIYYNSFYNNKYFNAKDLGNNFWDNGNIGNYWDDYEGQDNNGDGIGDEPYPIQGNNNFDNLPIVDITQYTLNTKPEITKFEGETSGTTGEKYGYAVVYYDEEYHDGVFEIDWGDGTSTEFSDFIGAGNENIFEHTFSEDGTYNVKVRAIDMLGSHSDWETLSVSMPKQKNSNFWTSFLQKIIENFPIFKQILVRF